MLWQGEKSVTASGDTYASALGSLLRGYPMEAANEWNRRTIASRHPKPHYS